MTIEPLITQQVNWFSFVDEKRLNLQQPTIQKPLEIVGYSTKKMA